MIVHSETEPELILHLFFYTKKIAWKQTTKTSFSMVVIGVRIHYTGYCSAEYREFDEVPIFLPVGINILLGCVWLLIYVFV